MKRIKHNDLTHYFIPGGIPRSRPAYLASCEKFFKSLKQQAASRKLQAPSLTEPGPGDSNRIIKEN